ncbi:hypothetical protein [uncultured Acetobacteroides sp.]|uniref:hypothetical protein n=1 Tax=uncultured Acetobacteroides sp. TaxID=1760811 RepID=UPI0029F45A41|nr:hypothetical protein [uncultured Acetobacteroides sp.]
MIKLKGSTIVEAIVSALIILITFGLALTIMVQLSAKKGGTDYYSARLAIDSVMREVSTTRQVSPQVLSFSWGNLSIDEPKPAENGCFLLTMRATSTQGALLDRRTTIVDSTLTRHEP